MTTESLSPEARRQMGVDQQARVETMEQKPEQATEVTAEQQEAAHAEAMAKVADCQAHIDGLRAELAFFEGVGEIPDDIKADLLMAEQALVEAQAAADMLKAVPEITMEIKSGQTVQETLQKAYAESFGQPEFNFQEVLDNTGDGYSESLKKLVAEAGTDVAGMAAGLKEKTAKLPEMWQDVNTALAQLEGEFAAKFGKGIKETFYVTPDKHPTPAQTAEMVAFIESHSATAAFARASQEIASLSQDNLKMALALAAKKGELYPGITKAHLDTIADQALKEVSQPNNKIWDASNPEVISRSTTQKISDAGLSLRREYSYVRNVLVTRQPNFN